MLYTKCRVATAPVTGEARTQVLQSCCDTLDLVKKNFSKIDAQTRLLHAWYLQVIRIYHFNLSINITAEASYNFLHLFQAQLYNEIGNIAARNQCAWMYRQLETQNPVEPSNMLLIMY